MDVLVCRLCLNSGGQLVNIFDENTRSEFMLEKTIEDLINVEVVEDARYPWLVCCNCMEKLTEFRLFKHRCAECLFVFYNRIQKECNPSTKVWITNRHECRRGEELKEEFGVAMIASEAVDRRRDMDVRDDDDMAVVKEEIDAASGILPLAPGKDVDSAMVASMREGGSHWSDSEEAGNLLPGGIKKECCNDPIASDAVDRTAVDVRDDMIVVKEEVDTASECSASLGRDIDSSLVPSMQEGCSHWSDSEEVGNMDRSEDGLLSFNVEVDIKEECQDDISQEEQRLGADPLQEEDCGKGRDGVMTILHMCQYCNDGFAQKEDLEAHVIGRHSLKARDIRRGVDSEGYHCASDIVAESKTYKCAICLRSFPLKNKLKRHLLMHTGERPHKCEICLKGFHHKQHLEGHMLTHTGERPHKCPVCPKAFTYKQSLKGHMYIHSGEKPYECEVCGKAFKWKRQLKEHRLTHKWEKRHKCEVCSRAFTRKANLKRHALIHTGERPYKCEICLKGFHHKQHLEGHMSTHTGEKPYKCEVCQKAFTFKQSLKGHMYIHTGEKPHRCDVCLEAFRHKQNLNEHMSIHRFGPQRCVVCSRPFAHSASLKRHMKVHRDTEQDAD
ncbi:zinc finger protein 492-like [Hetaerina americana]|uniref:zinc finger protein 492-like n=1 Tax=Hetaerina americana TaxID=62018 RepID=UPI003A7F2EEC